MAVTMWLCLYVPGTGLERIAIQALEWSPCVSLEPPDAVLVEVGGSLRLFGGVEGLWMQVQQDHEGADVALAPTPCAALWLARGAPGTQVMESAALRHALAPLPIEVMGLEPRVQARIHGFGIHDLRGLMRLPQAALARRVGPGVIEALQRATGTSPDPRRAWHPEPRYDGRRELRYETVDVTRIVQAAMPLLEEMVDRARASGCGIRDCIVHLVHRDGAPTHVQLGAVEPMRDAARWSGQLALHLERVILPAPVFAVAVHAARFDVIVDIARDLFVPRAQGEDWVVLLERLRARLGESAVFGLGLRPDHRPERAWTTHLGATPVCRAPSWPVGSRPLWLLEAPRPVLHPGRYRILRGPERIESGWWDGADVARDYFVADDPGGTRCWVYRDRRPPHDWYLHGLFG